MKFTLEDPEDYMTRGLYFIFVLTLSSLLQAVFGAHAELLASQSGIESSTNLIAIINHKSIHLSHEGFSSFKAKDVSDIFENDTKHILNFIEQIPELVKQGVSLFFSLLFVFYYYQ
jgi:ABC-type multidrug transport system fused ATPase/permease subunit